MLNTAGKPGLFQGNRARLAGGVLAEMVVQLFFFSDSNGLNKWKVRNIVVQDILPHYFFAEMISPLQTNNVNSFA